MVYLQQERWSDAITQATILVKDPTFIRPGRALVNRGWAHYKSGQLVEAESDFVQALDEGGAVEAAHMNLGIVYYDQGEVVRAVQQFKKVIELLEHRPPQIFGSGVAEARFRLARAYVKLGHRQKAIRHLELAEKRGGRDEWGRKSKEYLSVLR